MNKIVYCITTTKKWDYAREKGEYLDESLDNEGFIHCSYKHQLVRVANKHFPGNSNLLILCINCDKLSCKVIDEDLSNMNELYPHIYGPISITSVCGIIDFPCNSDGSFTLPREINL